MTVLLEGRKRHDNDAHGFYSLLQTLFYSLLMAMEPQTGAKAWVGGINYNISNMIM
jgi:hypothetical protein